MNSRLGLRVVPIALAALGVLSARGASAQRVNDYRVPAETVVRVRLDERLNSRNVAVGDKFTASLAPTDRSGFPLETRFHGTVAEVQRATKDEPGVLDMRFRRAELPDGRFVNIDGRLASLAEDDVRRTRDGRLRTRVRKDGGGGQKFDPKWVGYGAAGGAVLATIFGGGFLKGALLGGLGGAVYAYLNKDKNNGRGEFRDVELTKDTEFGVRMLQPVAFETRNNYRYARNVDPDDDRNDRINRNDRVRGGRDEFRFGSSTVMYNGREVEFGDLKPVNLNGVLYIPLRPVAEAANLRYQHRAGDDSFILHNRDGSTEGFVGETAITMRNREEKLEAAPVSIDGEIFVPTEYLNRVADMRVNWDRRNMRLELDTDE